MRVLRHIPRALRRFLRSDEASATVEFVIIFPAFILLMLSAFESGMLMTRQAMLERGVDMAIRQVRIGAMDPVTHDDLRDAICAQSAIIPNCASELKIEMRRVDLMSWTSIPARADCVNREDYGAPLEAFQAGSANQLMFVRVCALFDPVFPTAGLGAQLPVRSGGAYALVSTSAFVIEPL